METFYIALQGRNEETAALADNLSCPLFSDTVGTGLVGRRVAPGQFSSASMKDWMDSGKRHLSATGIRYWSWCAHFFPEHLRGNTKQIKPISSKGKEMTEPVLELSRSFGNKLLFNTPNKDMRGFLKYHVVNIE